MAKKTISLSFTDEDKAAATALAAKHGYANNLTGLFRAISHGDLIVQASEPPPDLRLTVQQLQERIEGLEDRLNGFSPTDLP